MTEAGWQELRFATTPEKVAELEDWLFQHGALAVTLKTMPTSPCWSPGPGNPLWQAIRLVGLFGQEADLKALVDGVPDHLLADPGVQTEQVPDRDWERVWMDEFKPMKLGRRLWICPSWCEPPDPAAVNINLDPGLAFGTGTHPTTALCLGQLDDWVRPGMTVVDYGCGSGILAIAALKLGAARPWVWTTIPRRSPRPARTDCAMTYPPRHLMFACRRRSPPMASGQGRPGGRQYSGRAPVRACSHPG